MRFIPDLKFDRMPCSYVGTGCAYEKICGKEFLGPFPEGLKRNGYLTLKDENRYLRSILDVEKEVYFKRGERIRLEAFLKQNDKKCCICVFGHFLYADGHDYWSFFDNDQDEIVCIWYLKGVLPNDF